AWLREQEGGGCCAGGQRTPPRAGAEADPRLRVGGQVRPGRRRARPRRALDEALESYFFLAAGLAAGAAAAFLPLAGGGAATATFASCFASRPLRRAALRLCRMPLAAARSSARIASS